MVKCFECSSCNYYKDLDINDSISRCPECGCGTYRIRYNPKEVKTEVVNITYKDSPRYSVSMGVPETQIEAARKLHPQAEWKRFGHSFRPLIKNRPEKLKMMRQCGMEEFGVEQFKGRQ